MFGSKRPDTDTAPSADTTAAREGKAAPRVSEIAAGLTVVGEISGDGDVRLDGRLEGNVRCRALVIGAEGELVGKVTAQEVKVHGTVRGDIRATQVTLDSHATVLGDVQHEVLQVAAGARIEGRYSRGLAKVERKPATDAVKEPPPKAPQRPLAKPANAGAQPIPPAATASAVAAAKSDA